MTAKEFDTMVKGMRTRYNTFESRGDVQDTIWYLRKGLIAIKRNDLADELMKLYGEVDTIDTLEIMEMGTFK